MGVPAREREKRVRPRKDNNKNNIVTMKKTDVQQIIDGCYDNRHDGFASIVGRKDGKGYEVIVYTTDGDDPVTVVGVEEFKQSELTVEDGHVYIYIDGCLIWRGEVSDEMEGCDFPEYEDLEDMHHAFVTGIYDRFYDNLNKMDFDYLAKLYETTSEESAYITHANRAGIETPEEFYNRNIKEKTPIARVIFKFIEEN